MRALDARHGRVLLQDMQPQKKSSSRVLDGLVVWNPITGERQEVPGLPVVVDPSCWSAAVLCAAAGDGCDHLSCHHRGHFRVVVVGINPQHAYSYSCVYSSKPGYVVTGDAISRKKSIELLEELGLPKGLLPMEDIQEFGYNRATGFMWLVQGKKKVEHTFKKIKQTVSYATDVTAFAEKGKLRKITGVKTKELMLWLSVVEVYVPDASPEKISLAPPPIAMAPPPELPEGLVEEILLRVPPDDPATLLRVALVCKRWCRLISGAAFRRRFRERHQSPPILGFFYQCGEKTRFTPTASFRPLGADAAAAGAWCPVDARHGRVLFYDVVSMWPFRFEFVVSDPITGGQRRLPMPRLLQTCCSWSAAFLCAAAGCNHLDCPSGGPFTVVVVGTDTCWDFTSATVYSSEAGSWSVATSVEHPRGCVDGGSLGRGGDGQIFGGGAMKWRCALVANALYFMFERSDQILEYNVVEQELSVISGLPSECNNWCPSVMTAEDGGLGLAYAQESYARFRNRRSKLYMWSREETDQGWEWVHRRTINLKRLLPHSAFLVFRKVIAIANGIDLVMSIANNGVFNIHLKSGRVTKIGDIRDSFYGVVPYLSFYTPRSQPLGVGSTLPMAASMIESHRAGAEVVNGDAICRKKSVELLEELGLPKGLLPMEGIREFGYNRATGFMWLVQGKKVEHTFKKIKQTVSYAAEVTAFAEKGKLRKITGVKTKELMLWLSVVEVYVPEASPEKVTFKTGTGLSDSFDAVAFALGE
ncbi:hypothetical protein BAE44_0020815 [Dichanthelium oligosanthes]|uniref:F-box domain-containing protein n=1 Tax=Dichanthelium oligosanthes TaxID=888268 RepID=A0A1E5UZG9_9POAL|nr:hypothetical protein BAE44_0020815 [Dichanthelium oligosanthes]